MSFQNSSLFLCKPNSRFCIFTWWSVHSAGATHTKSLINYLMRFINCFLNFFLQTSRCFIQTWSIVTWAFHSTGALLSGFSTILYESCICCFLMHSVNLITKCYMMIISLNWRSTKLLINYLMWHFPVLLQSYSCWQWHDWHWYQVTAP